MFSPLAVPVEGLEDGTDHHGVGSQLSGTPHVGADANRLSALGSQQLNEDDGDTVVKGLGWYPSAEDLPNHSDVDAILQLPWWWLAERDDWRRLHAKMLYSISSDEQASLQRLVPSVSYRKWRSKLLTVLHDDVKFPLHEDQSDPWMRMACFHVSWVHCCNMEGRSVSKACLEELMENEQERSQLKKFHHQLCALLCIKGRSTDPNNVGISTPPTANPTLLLHSIDNNNGSNGGDGGDGDSK